MLSPNNSQKRLIRSAPTSQKVRRTGTKDVVNFLIYSRGSMYETKDRLQKAIRRKLIPTARGDVIIKRLEHLAPSLNAYITAKRRTLRQRPTT